MEPHFQIGHDKETFVKTASREGAAKHDRARPADQVSLLEQAATDDRRACKGTFLLEAGPHVDRLRLFVHNLPRGRDQTYRVISGECGRHPSERFARTEEIVGMQPLYVLTASQGQASVPILNHSAMNRSDPNLYPRVFLRVALSDFNRAIGRSIVRNDELKILERLVYHGLDRFR